MINRILMELYDDYEKNNIESLIEFTNKTFPNNGIDKLFIGCVLILFSRTGGYKPRYDVSRENLYSIVLSAKEKIGSTNLLAFYVERINTKKGINKYLKDVVNSKNIDEYTDIILDYLDQFKPKFVSNLKNNHKKIEEYKMKKSTLEDVIVMNNSNNNRQNATSINWYPGHMAKAKRLIAEKINYIDIVFEVIDARMPYSSKIKDIKNYTKNKPTILIFTKMDLCDPKETQKWISYYEQKGEKVIPLSLEQNQNIKKIVTNAVEEVMVPFQKAREEKGMKERKTRILIVGIPNAGKSTLINRLVGKKAVNVGNRPGITKSLDWIRINNSLELLDTPGILWPKLEEENSYVLASLTAIKEEILPLEAVAIYILKMLVKYYPKIAYDRYGIESVSEDVVETFDIVGNKRGCLSKGGFIDYDKVYSIIIGDIKNGLVKGITFDRIENIKKEEIK